MTKNIRFSATLAYQYASDFSPFPPAEFGRALDWAKAAGMDGVEPCVAHYGGADLAALKAGLDARGLVCSTISTGQAYGLEGISLSEEDAVLRERAVIRVREHADAAAYLGGFVTVGLLRGRGDARAGAAGLARLRESLSACAEYARTKRVTLLLEPINRYESCLLNSAEEAAAFLDEMGGPPNLRILWDVFHSNIEDVSFERALDALGDKLGYVHLADSNRAFPGQGHTDFATVFRLLEKAGYAGFASFECLNRPSGEYVREHVKEFVSSIRCLLS